MMIDTIPPLRLLLYRKCILLHFYRAGRVIVIYAGNNEATLNALQAVLGEPFVTVVSKGYDPCVLSCHLNYNSERSTSAHSKI